MRGTAVPLIAAPHTAAGAGKRTAATLLGSESASAWTDYPRGRPGVVGLRLTGFRFDINPGCLTYIEMPEEDLTAAASTSNPS